MAAAEIPFPSIGSGYGFDYDPGRRSFKVPMVLKSKLVQRGASFIEQHPPPRIELLNGRVFVLVTHQTIDKFLLQPKGLFRIDTKANGSLKLPHHKHTDMNSDIAYMMVSQNILARRGLLSSTSNLPRLSMSVNENNVMSTFFVLSPEMVSRHNLPTAGKFILPLAAGLPGKAPYPLSLKHAESFAIPPKPKEFAGGDASMCVVL